MDDSQSLLTNALSGWHDTGDVKLNFPEMRDEYDASQKVKRTAQIIVILGNPPYDRFAGAAQAEEAELVANYKGVTLIDDVDRKTRQTKLDEFGRPKRSRRDKAHSIQRTACVSSFSTTYTFVSCA
jgi:hypothetical protein